MVMLLLRQVHLWVSHDAYLTHKVTATIECRTKLQMGQDIGQRQHTLNSESIHESNAERCPHDWPTDDVIDNMTTTSLVDERFACADDMHNNGVN